MSWVAKHLTVHNFLSLKKAGFYHIETRGGRMFITIHKPAKRCSGMSATVLASPLKRA